MTVLAAPQCPLPNPPPQAGEGIEGPTRIELVTAGARTRGVVYSLSRLRGRVGEGALPLGLSYERGPLRPEEQQDHCDD
jgi:hypothetical protein